MSQQQCTWVELTDGPAKLTAGQVELLLFFADPDRVPPRRIQPNMYDFLTRKGLLQQPSGSPCYQITDLGLRAARTARS